MGIYVTSLASNEMFTPSITMAFVFTTVLLLSAGLLFIDPMIMPKTPLYDFSLPLKNLAYSSDLSLISTIYNPTVMNLTIFIVFYLLLTLIVVVKIAEDCKARKGLKPGVPDLNNYLDKL